MNPIQDDTYLTGALIGASPWKRHVLDPGRLSLYPMQPEGVCILS